MSSSTKELFLSSATTLLIYGAAIAGLLYFYLPSSDRPDEAPLSSEHGLDPLTATAVSETQPIGDTDAARVVNSTTAEQLDDQPASSGVEASADATETPRLIPNNDASKEHEGLVDTHGNAYNDDDNRAPPSTSSEKPSLDVKAPTVASVDSIGLSAVDSGREGDTSVVQTVANTEIALAESSTTFGDGAVPNEIDESTPTNAAVAEAPTNPGPALATPGADVLVGPSSGGNKINMSGRVIDASESPVDGLRVFAYDIETPDSPKAQTLTNAGGDFQFPELPKALYQVETEFGDVIAVHEFATSGSVDLYIVANRLGKAAIENQVLATNAPAPELRVGSGDHFVSGLVTNEAGDPLQGVSVVQLRGDVTTTDANGRYETQLRGVTTDGVVLGFRFAGHTETRRRISPTYIDQTTFTQLSVVMRKATKP